MIYILAAAAACLICFVAGYYAGRLHQISKYLTALQIEIARIDAGWSRDGKEKRWTRGGDIDEKA